MAETSQNMVMRARCKKCGAMGPNFIAAAYHNRVTDASPVTGQAPRADGGTEETGDVWDTPTPSCFPEPDGSMLVSHDFGVAPDADAPLPPAQHMHMFCNNCGYQWHQEPLDSGSA